MAPHVKFKIIYPALHNLQLISIALVVRHPYKYYIFHKTWFLKEFNTLPAYSIFGAPTATSHIYRMLINNT